MTWYLTVLTSLYFFAPAGIASMAPVLMKKTFPRLAVPLDFGMEWKGKPILGKNKTLRGLVWGVVFSVVIFWLQQYAYRFNFFKSVSLVNYPETSVWLGILLGLGSMVGDAVKSFFKRRISIGPGQSWIPFDQIDFVIGAIAFTFFMAPLTWQIIVSVLVSYFLLHIFFNHLGYWLRINKKKW